MTHSLDADLAARIAVIPPLSSGKHKSLKDGACIMEAVAYVAGEPWSDAPACVCPVIAAFCRSWNDGLSDKNRDAILRPLVPRLINTRGNDAVAHRRALMAVDWLIREHAPAWLRVAGLTAHADALIALPEIADVAQLQGVQGIIDAARKDAAAARAACDAAWDAAWDAGAAAWAAGGAAWAAWAAGDAAWAAWAAGAAAWDAARAAAWDAWAAGDAGDVPNPTRLGLQQSALRLVHRMIDCGREG